MKKILVLLALLALATPGTALAKGASKAEVDGPGIGKALVLGGGEDMGTPAGRLAQAAGFFAAAFCCEEPDPMLDARPKGDLGPKYTITWTMPGPNGGADSLRQDVYPYAEQPVTYMAAGQTFFESMKTRGGWFMADPSIKQTLVEAGLPTAPPSAAADDGGRSFPTTLVAVLGVALALAAGSVLLVRRRARPAAA